MGESSLQRALEHLHCAQLLLDETDLWLPAAALSGVIESVELALSTVQPHNVDAKAIVIWRKHKARRRNHC